MVVWIAWGIAVASTAACVTLWFREVRRVLGSLRSTVESAAAHLAACRNRAAQLNDAEASVIRPRPTTTKPWRSRGSICRGG